MTGPAWGFHISTATSREGTTRSLLEEEVAARLEGDVGIANAAEAIVGAPVHGAPPAHLLDDILVAAPTRERDRTLKFKESPKLFVLPGSLRESCVLDPVQYRASLA